MFQSAPFFIGSMCGSNLCIYIYIHLPLRKKQRNVRNISYVDPLDLMDYAFCCLSCLSGNYSNCFFFLSGCKCEDPREHSSDLNLPISTIPNGKTPGDLRRTNRPLILTPPQNYFAWWLNQPTHRKNMLVKMGFIFPKKRWIQKNKNKPPPSILQFKRHLQNCSKLKALKPMWWSSRQFQIRQ